MPSTNAVESHGTTWDFGYPAAKMLKPWLPPRVNFTGTALPALTLFSTGRLSTGGKNPWKLSVVLPHVPVVQVVAVVQKLASSHVFPFGSLRAS